VCPHLTSCRRRGDGAQCPKFLQPKATIILNAIAQGMYKEQTNNAIKLAATRALANALEFTRENFAKEVRRAEYRLFRGGGRWCFCHPRAVLLVCSDRARCIRNRVLADAARTCSASAT
jgi:hypothetical protein